MPWNGVNGFARDMWKWRFCRGKVPTLTRYEPTRSTSRKHPWKPGQAVSSSSTIVRQPRATKASERDAQWIHPRHIGYVGRGHPLLSPTPLSHTMNVRYQKKKRGKEKETSHQPRQMAAAFIALACWGPGALAAQPMYSGYGCRLVTSHIPWPSSSSVVPNSSTCDVSSIKPPGAFSQCSLVHVC